MTIRRIVPETLAGKIIACSALACFVFATMVRAQDSYTIRGVVRDFHESHPAMETTNPDRVALNLGPLTASSEPTWTGNGQKIAEPWKDVAKNDIAPILYDAALGDTLGSYAHADSAGYTAESFASMWHDVLGENLSKTIDLTMTRNAKGLYEYTDLSFYPIDNQLFGNEGDRHNFYFAVEFHLNFVAGSGQWFTFACDDEVFVYVNGVLVTDLAGKVAAHEQLAMFDRLNLVDGQTYNVDIFFADRHRIGQKIRFTTNINFATSWVEPIFFPCD